MIHTRDLRVSQYRSRIYMAPGLYFDSEFDTTNAWHRFWQRILLGSTWERIDG